MSSPVDVLIADIKAAAARLAARKFETPDDVRLVLIDDTYPMMEALAEQLVEVDKIVEEMTQPESFLDDEEAQHIRSALALGGALYEIVQKLLPQMNDIDKKKAGEVCAAFENAVQLAMMVVEQATEGDEEDEEEDDTEADDGDESTVEEGATDE